MNENENLVTNVTENAEQTAEQTPKHYTDEEVNAIVGKRLARQEARIRKEYDRKYGDLTEVLRAGTGKEDVEEMTDTFKKFYQSKGIKMPDKADYSAKDIETLARAEANEYISAGFEDVVEEADRLNAIGEKMTAREKAVFKILAEHVKATETNNKLAEIGLTEDEYNSPDFKEFQSMFNPNTPIEKVYETYRKTQPKKEFKTMGSMKNSTSQNGTVKDFYTRDEALQFTKADFDKNPALYKAVEASMLKW
jgi:hypothetical protein